MVDKYIDGGNVLSLNKVRLLIHNIVGVPNHGFGPSENSRIVLQKIYVCICVRVCLCYFIFQNVLYGDFQNYPIRQL